MFDCFFENIPFHRKRLAALFAVMRVTNCVRGGLAACI